MPYPHMAMTEGHMVKIKVNCIQCDEPQRMEANADGYIEWHYGDEYIQDAMPELSPDEREMLISGVCPKCWDKMFPKEESDE